MEWVLIVSLILGAVEAGYIGHKKHKEKEVQVCIQRVEDDGTFITECRKEKRKINKERKSKWSKVKQFFRKKKK